MPPRVPDRLLRYKHLLPAPHSPKTVTSKSNYKDTNIPSFSPNRYGRDMPATEGKKETNIVLQQHIRAQHAAVRFCGIVGSDFFLPYVCHFVT